MSLCSDSFKNIFLLKGVRFCQMMSRPGLALPLGWHKPCFAHKLCLSPLGQLDFSLFHFMCSWLGGCYYSSSLFLHQVPIQSLLQGHSLGHVQYSKLSEVV